jgi:fucose 4-O-acetylase-like acetyltransferase
MWAQVVVTFIIFSFIYMVFELFARRGERKMLIEKIVEIGKADVGRYLNEYLGNTGMANIFRMKSRGSIRGALLMLGIGIGVMAGFFINYLLVGDAYLTSNRHWDVCNEEVVVVVYIASVCIFGGLGMLIAYFIERKENGKLKMEN